MIKSLKYIVIDKRILNKGDILLFSIFNTNKDRTEMKLLISKGETINNKNLILLNNYDKVYINDKERYIYENYCQKNIQNIAKSEKISINDKSIIIYEKASHTIDDMFKNPETLEVVKNIKPLVDDMVNLILHDQQAVQSLLKITAHDYYTHTHSINVSIYTLSLGIYLGLKEEELKTLGIAAILHDIGKSNIDYDIINKNGKLTEMEFDSMKSHPEIGLEIATTLGITDKRILNAISQHHEKMDGSGYPFHLKSNEISEFAKIIGICDIFDALTTKRSYKESMTTFESIKLMKSEMADKIDLNILNSFILMFKSS